MFRAIEEAMKEASMNLEAFAQYIRGKSVLRLLHHARKESLKRILAHEDVSPTLRKKSVQKRTGTR